VKVKLIYAFHRQWLNRLTDSYPTLADGRSCGLALSFVWSRLTACMGYRHALYCYTNVSVK